MQRQRRSNATRIIDQAFLKLLQSGTLEDGMQFAVMWRLKSSLRLRDISQLEQVSRKDRRVFSIPDNAPVLPLSERPII
ncbi:MAG: hypothetical protein QF898_00505, partial [SAR202 cluster bacterium]|nr:hypothetical protein [SAR202 cluster bacterium]